MALLETKNLTFKYGIGTPFEKTAMDNVNIQINEGEFIGVIGHTGSGKSTLVQHFNGLIRPTDGQVLFDGKDIWAEPKKIRNIRFKIGAAGRKTIGLTFTAIGNITYFVQFVLLRLIRFCFFLPAAPDYGCRGAGCLTCLHSSEVCCRHSARGSRSSATCCLPPAGEVPCSYCSSSSSFS